MMVGRSVALEAQIAKSRGGEVRLSVKDLCVRGDRGTQAVSNLSLEVSSGEIVGDRRECPVTASGSSRRQSPGFARRSAAPSGWTTPSSPAPGRSTLRNAGLAYVPEERMRDGVVPYFTVEQNLLLVDNRDPRYSRLGFLRKSAIRRHCQELVSDFDVRTPSLDTPVRNLSGGNIQKLIMARELSGSPRVILVAQPTRGIDVGATLYIHERLADQRDRGTAVLIVSEDLDEIMTICDRVLVMYEGQIIGSADPRVNSREDIGMMMAGCSAHAPPPRSQPRPSARRGGRCD